MTTNIDEVVNKHIVGVVNERGIDGLNFEKLLDTIGRKKMIRVLEINRKALLDSYTNGTTRERLQRKLQMKKDANEEREQNK